MENKIDSNAVENRISTNRKITADEAFMIVTSAKYRKEHKIKLVETTTDSIGVENGTEKDKVLVKTIIKVKKYYVITHIANTEDGFFWQIALEVKKVNEHWRLAALNENANNKH